MVNQWERDLARSTAVDYGPIANMYIVVRGNGRVIEAMTDDRGRYNVTVPPGEYEVSAIPPPGYSTARLQRDVEVRAAGACHQTDFGVQFDGRVTGVVRLPSGEPAGAIVELVASDSAGERQVEAVRVTSDANGSYEFVELSPGRYVVGVDITRHMQADVVFPATFFAGTPERDAASIIELGGGEQRRLPAMTLPAPRRPLRLTGSIVFADGRPAAGASVSLLDSEVSWRWLSRVSADPDGTFSFPAHDGLRYWVSATFRDGSSQRPFTAGTSWFVMSPELAPLKIVLAPVQ